MKGLAKLNSVEKYFFILFPSTKVSLSGLFDPIIKCCFKFNLKLRLWKCFQSELCSKSKPQSLFSLVINLKHCSNTFKLFVPTILDSCLCVTNSTAWLKRASWRCWVNLSSHFIRSFLGQKDHLSTSVGQLPKTTEWAILMGWVLQIHYDKMLLYQVLTKWLW